MISSDSFESFVVAYKLFNSSISNCIIGSDVTIGKGCVLSCSVIDDGTTIGSNFVGESGRASIQWRGQLYHVESIGVMVGEDTFIEPQASALPGTVIGAACHIGPGTVVRQSLENKSRVS